MSLAGTSHSPLRIGTRASRLALWQAEHVRALLTQLHPGLAVEVVEIHTLGDKDTVTPLAQLGVGLFTKELEEGLRDRRCDLAVHSLKDVPTQLHADFALVAILEREDPRDAFVSQSGLRFSQLPRGATVGTSSLRRRAQLLHLRPDLKAVNLRGNVPTRLRAVGVALDEGKPRAGELLDATLLALAGLKRLGFGSHITEIMEPTFMLPAPAQGAIGIEVRAADASTAALVRPLDHGPTRQAVTAERSLLRTLEGGCRVPIGALCRHDGAALYLDAFVGSDDGVRLVRAEVSGSDPEELGARLAGQLVQQGARAILDDILRQQGPRGTV